ncbi:MAG: PAS domain-containing sensor histidine kinase [Balneolaceae bacterium]
MKGTDFNYELFFELSKDLVCIAGYDGFFKKVNSTVCNVLGYTKEELYSRRIEDFVYEDDRENTTKSRNYVKKSNTLFNFENRYVTKGGEIVWLAWTSHPVGKDELVFAIAKDITHKKRLEVERLVLMEKITSLNQELKQLSLTTSHDLRSPLGSLLMIFDLLDVSKISDQETVKLLELLKKTGEDLKESLNTYVDLLSEKVNERKKVEEVFLDEILKKVTQSISSLIETTQTTIRVDFSKVEKINFNNSHMESVFLNLISNSIKYSQPDISPEISIYTEKQDGTIRLIIEDNGRGFEMEQAKGKIFGMNQTFHTHKDSKGVGLYLVHNHITSFGGTIDVESEINEGTRFVISFED